MEIRSKLRLSLVLITVILVISSTNALLPIAAKNNNVDTSAQHSGFSLENSSTLPPISPTSVSHLDSGFTTQGALGSLTARPTNNIVNTNSFYDVVFLTATSGAIKKIEVTFPAGTIIPSGAFFNEAEGIGPGSVGKSGQTITYTVTNAINVPVGTKIRLEFANINNPLNPSASYQVAVTTRNAANAIIDGPTQSTAYTMKQIGTDAIADNSITSSKPAESFMKQVFILDNAAGHEVGWDPDGVRVAFTIIPAPGVTGSQDNFVSVMSDFSPGGTSNCDVPWSTTTIGSFHMVCDRPPLDGVALIYQSVHVPSQIVN